MAFYRNSVGEVESESLARFREEVIDGLQSHPKSLPSRYFYDAEGTRLFREIMKAPEYYLTGCEMEIFEHQTADLGRALFERSAHFDVVELGAGDASKSIHLLRYLKKKRQNFRYYPLDISGDAIDYLEQTLPLDVPGLEVHGIHGEYFDAFTPGMLPEGRKVFLLLGANIGNASPQEAMSFLSALRKQMNKGDLLVVGFDLVKDPVQILAAYNDAEGLTRQFNFNLLHRINRELDATFHVDEFEHFPVYDPSTGACLSYLVSRTPQLVRIGEEEISLAAYEAICTERSQKYTVDEVKALALKSGFKGVHQFFDHRGWFLDAVWENE